MTEEKLTSFFDRMFASTPEEISKDDLIRYIKEGHVFRAVAPSVRERLLALVEASAIAGERS